MMEAVVAAAVAGVLGTVWLLSRRSRAGRPEVCDRCGKARVLLGEETEDVHLDERQRREEQVGAADYHVWWCEACESGAVVRHALSSDTRVVGCEKCGRATATEIAQTVQVATPSQGGEFRIHLSCQGCGHSQRFWRYTPRRR